MQANQKRELPILRDSQSLLLEIEQAVRGFPRYQKYTLGSDLRRQGMLVCRLVNRALNSQGSARLHQVQRLLNCLDDLKVLVRLGKSLQAYQNFGQFQRISELAVATSKQGGRWHRQLLARNTRPAPEVQR